MSNCCGGLTLERWRQIIGYNPYHFYQLANNTTLKLASECNTIVTEYAWQTADAVGREDIRNAIDTAIERLTDYLDYSPYPRYFDEVHPLQFNAFRGRGCATVRLKTGRVIGFGVQAFEEVATDTVYQATDRNGDGIWDTWQIEIVDTVELPVALADAWLYPKADDLPYLSQDASAIPYDCRWMVKPLRYAIVDLDPQQSVYYYGNSWETVKPNLYNGATIGSTGQIDVNATASYWAQPTLLREYTNPNGVTTSTAAVIFEFDNPCGCEGCGCGSQSLPYTRLGQATMWDARTGEVIVYPATYNAETETWTASEFCGCHLPDRVRIRYYAGDTSDCRWDEIVTRLAAAELARPICACQQANRELYHWQFDLARTTGANDEAYAVSPAALDNPLGTRRGHVYTWERVKRLGLVRAVAL